MACQEGCTALHAAAEKGHSMLAEILLNGGADIDAQDMVRLDLTWSF